jgi:hypothetical protein
MIQSFNQYINESKNIFSVHETINKPFAEFINTAHDRLNAFTEHIQKLLIDMDTAIESVKDEFGSAIVGEPVITVDKYLSDITAKFNTTAPNNDEAWKAEESQALDIEYRLMDMFDDRNKVRAEIYHEPNEEGNCVIVLHTYVIDEDNFGDYIDVLTKLGETYK